MATTLYDIRRDALNDAGRDRMEDWPDGTLTLRWVRQGLIELQERCSFYRKTVTVAFEASANYKELLTGAGEYLHLVRLNKVVQGNLPQNLAGIDELRSFRYEGVSVLSAALCRYFALNKSPLDKDYGTVWLEAWPPYSEATSVEATYETVPALVDTVSDSQEIDLPHRPLQHYLAWRISMSRNADRAAAHWGAFLDACRTLRGSKDLTGHVTTGRPTGFLAQQAAEGEV